MKVIVAGDFCPIGCVEKEFNQGNYEVVLHDVVSITQSADYSIVNFECPIGNGLETAISKCGPNLRCGINAVKALKYAKFDCVTLANNHFFDYGQEGVDNTIGVCKEAGIETVGGGKNLLEASKTLFKKKEGKTLAIINCCEHEFSIASESRGGSNPLNPIRQYYAIREAREKADYVLVIVHGGHEFYQLPSPRMQETYRFFIDAGADAVVNHHQHCYSGYEVYKSKPILYGLGNFCFDKIVETKDRNWHEGFLVELDFRSDMVSFSLHPYLQCVGSPSLQMLSEDAFKVKLKELNSIICDSEKLKKSIEDYYKNSRAEVFSVLRPIKNSYIKALQDKKFFPMFMSINWLNQLRNYIMCEAHRDKLEHFFKSNIY